MVYCVLCIVMTIQPQHQQASMEDSSNPFFLHHGDNPRVSYASHTLTSENSHTWSRLMTTILSAKNKLGFV